MNASKDEIGKLYQANERFGEAALHNDEEGIIKQDMHIHETIYIASKNVKLQTMINSLREQMQRFRAEYVHRIEDKTPLVNQHMEIIRQIEKGECRKANLAACDHIYTTGDSMLSLLEKTE
jgi:DNA-binding GntR family transcriptional regulator